MSWTISKDFFFDYSHRVWVQKLREDFCAKGDTGTKCRFLHGHTGKVTLSVQGDTLNPQSMLCDFKELGFAKDFLDTYIDHKMIIDKNDPLFSQITNGLLVDDRTFSYRSGNLPLLKVTLDKCDYITGYVIDVSTLEGTLKEFFESFFIVDFVPTSENLAAWIYDWAQAKLNQIDVQVDKVIWSETPKSQAIYSR